MSFELMTTAVYDLPVVIQGLGHLDDLVQLVRPGLLLGRAFILSQVVKNAHTDVPVAARYTSLVVLNLLHLYIEAFRYASVAGKTDKIEMSGLRVLGDRVMMGMVPWKPSSISLAIVPSFPLLKMPNCRLFAL